MPRLILGALTLFGLAVAQNAVIIHPKDGVTFTTASGQTIPNAGAAGIEFIPDLAGGGFSSERNPGFTFNNVDGNRIFCNLGGNLVGGSAVFDFYPGANYMSPCGAVNGVTVFCAPPYPTCQ